ncbi:MAG: class I SAM-dependent methyltransferase [Acidobacteria bacterium]|nr:MAG: class I SAM-dependent methyltransferase [Acidobacteriota bacterium]
MDGIQPDLRQVRNYWERNPVAARAVPHELGSPDYFAYYDSLREANESPSFSAALHEYADFAGKRVLDVGSGNGYVLSRYAAAGARTVGIDLTETAVDLCRRRFRLMRLCGHFIVGNAESLPFENGSFDCVCSMGVLHHTPETGRAVRELFRVLRPGGRLIVMFYHRDSLQYRLKFPIMKWLRGISIQESVNRVDGIGNPKGDVYSRAELTGLLDGFANLELYAGVLPWHKLRWVARIVPAPMKASLERQWGWFLYAKGIRPA